MYQAIENTRRSNIFTGGRSGAIEINGKTVAEQIGGEIFVDAFAMCAPGMDLLSNLLMQNFNGKTDLK